jgi:hypothetical protein
MTITFFGKHFPDANRVAGRQFWDGHFPDGAQDPSVVPGFGPAGVATLVLDIENGFTITHKWGTEIQRMGNGTERRRSTIDAPNQFFSGSALLVGNDPRAVRAKLAKFAAAGATFLLGLRHESLTIITSASGTSVFVPSAAMALVDWAKPGQRVVVGSSTSFVNAVIQSASGGTIVLDVAPGSAGAIGNVIMPAMPVFLESQQDFERYPMTAERWQFRAVAVIPDFAPTRASLALDTITVSSAFDGVVIYAREFGAIGNTRTFSLANTVPYNTVSDSGGAVVYHFQAGVTTLAQMAATLATSSYVMMGGTYNGADTIAAGDAFTSPFTSYALSGGAIAGDVGTGATLTTYAGDGTSRPVWDRALDNDETNMDSVHAMTIVIDYGGLPYSLQATSLPHYGRALPLVDGSQADWQWWRKFTATTKGAFKFFWLPTWRNDLTFVSRTLPGGGVTSLVVSLTDGSDFFAWWPTQRQHVLIRETNGTKTYAKITVAVDNGNGTLTLTIGALIATASVDLISWLELAHFEKDDFSIAWSTKGFSL